MKYCQSCVLPDTRPNLRLGSDGICNACQSHNTKQVIDWEAREKAFRAVVDRAKRHSNGYDCLIPVSGGKDSTWQTVKCLEYGLNPLAVTWKTPARTPIGQQNLDNLVALGVDHIDYQINPKVERKFLYESFKRYGSTAIPMHMALFNIPLKIAAKFEIPLVVWGENSAFEYGSRDEEHLGFQLDEHWLRTYGVTHGTTASDWISDHLSQTELTPYFGPSAQELADKNVLAIFLGYYFPWDVETSLQVALDYGFQRGAVSRTGYYDYADIDDDFISLHHWLKWYKFGFTRTFDNLSLEIRNGRMTREAAVQFLRDRGDETPSEDIEKFCQFLDITPKHFFEIAETFRNHKIWKKTGDRWEIRDFLIPDWQW